MRTKSDGVRGDYEPKHLEMIQRQMLAWTDGEVANALQDWSDTGVLMAPRGVRVLGPDIPDVIRQWGESFGELDIELRSLFVSSDGLWMSVEWSWTVSRRSDGARGTTIDAIVVELDATGLILGWNEYFDTFGSVEFA